MEQIAIGDLVELNSGGPPMEVVALGVRASDQQPTAACIWSDDDGEMHRVDFPCVCLTKLS